MSPEFVIGKLDDALAKAGEDIVLRRIYGQAPRTNYVDVTVRATVRSFSPEELVGGINQTDSKVIISPTDIANAGWPGGEIESTTVVNPSLPRINDFAIINGRKRAIQVVDPIYVQDELVRVEMRVLG
jgi:hypothetical protein